MRSARAVRIATRLYGMALGLTLQSIPKARRDQMRETFTDACRPAWQADGRLGVIRLLLPELWDVICVAIRTRLGLGTSVSMPAARLPQSSPRRNWAIALDVRQAWRGLLARRAETALVVMLLALGLATSSSVFGVADALLWHPAPFPDPDRLVQVWSSEPTQHVSTSVMPLDVAPRWLERTDLFASGGLSQQVSALVTDHGDPQVIPATLLSPGLLETLGVRPILGRTFARDEGRPGSDHVVILSDEVWNARFGRSPGVIGQTLHINGAAYAVVGVMGADFRFPYERQRLWMPLSLEGGTTGYGILTVRLRPDVARDVARRQIEAAGPAIAAQARRPWRYHGATMVPLGEMALTDATRHSVALLFGSTALLLVMVCMNVANLRLARLQAQKRDVAIRSALGASRLRLVRETVVEQVLVGLAALAVAEPLTVGGLRLAQALVPTQLTFSSLHTIRLDGRLLAAMTGLAMAAPLLASIVPALAGSRTAVIDVLRLESRSTTGTRRSKIFRQVLVVLEVACAVVLLVSAALLGRSFVRLQQADLGFDSRNLVSVSLQFPFASFPTDLSRDLYVDRAVDRIARLPGVHAVTPASGVPPLNGLIAFGSVVAEGQLSRPNMLVSGYDVRPEFFATLGIALTAGRPLLLGEDRRHVIVSQSIATLLWPQQDPIGKRFRWDDDSPDWSEVVGVAATIREDLDFPQQQLQVYIPLQRHGVLTPPPARRPATADPMSGSMRLAVRVADPATVMPLVRETLRAADPSVVQVVERVDDELARALNGPRFLLALMAMFAAAGLALSAAGVYAVLSCLVAQQMREIAVRLMLGARPLAVARRIVGGGLAPVVIGISVGVCVMAAVARVLSSLLFSVQTDDAWSYATVAVVLVLAAIGAAWRPARRAMSADPLALLRSE